MRNETASRTFLLFLSHIFSWKLKGQFSQLVKDFFFPPLLLCHLMLSPLWKQQIYAWSWTGKNWILLPVGILPWRAAGSDERFHPDQIREYSTMSLFSQETLLSSEREPGVRAQLGAPQDAQDSLCYEGGGENVVRLSFFFLYSLNQVCQSERSPVWTQRGGFLHHAAMLCLMMLRSRGKTCVSSHLSTNLCLMVLCRCTTLSSHLC